MVPSADRNPLRRGLPSLSVTVTRQRQEELYGYWSADKQAARIQIGTPPNVAEATDLQRFIGLAEPNNDTRASIGDSADNFLTLPALSFLQAKDFKWNESQAAASATAGYFSRGHLLPPWPCSLLYHPIMEYGITNVCNLAVSPAVYMAYAASIDLRDIVTTEKAIAVFIKKYEGQCQRQGREWREMFHVLPQHGRGKIPAAHLPAYRAVCLLMAQSELYSEFFEWTETLVHCLIAVSHIQVTLDQCSDLYINLPSLGSGRASQPYSALNSVYNKLLESVNIFRSWNFYTIDDLYQKESLKIGISSKAFPSVRAIMDIVSALGSATRSTLSATNPVIDKTPTLKLVIKVPCPLPALFIRTLHCYLLLRLTDLLAVLFMSLPVMEKMMLAADSGDSKSQNIVFRRLTTFHKPLLSLGRALSNLSVFLPGRDNLYKRNKYLMMLSRIFPMFLEKPTIKPQILRHLLGIATWTRDHFKPQGLLPDGHHRVYRLANRDFVLLQPHQAHLDKFQTFDKPEQFPDSLPHGTVCDFAAVENALDRLFSPVSPFSAWWPVSDHYVPRDLQLVGRPETSIPSTDPWELPDCVLVLPHIPPKFQPSFSIWIEPPKAPSFVELETAEEASLSTVSKSNFTEYSAIGTLDSSQSVDSSQPSSLLSGLPRVLPSKAIQPTLKKSSTSKSTQNPVPPSAAPVVPHDRAPVKMRKPPPVDDSDEDFSIVYDEGYHLPSARYQSSSSSVPSKSATPSGGVLKTVESIPLQPRRGTFPNRFTQFQKYFEGYLRGVKQAISDQSRSIKLIDDFHWAETGVVPPGAYDPLIPVVYATHRTLFRPIPVEYKDPGPYSYITQNDWSALVNDPESHLSLANKLLHTLLPILPLYVTAAFEFHPSLVTTDSLPRHCLTAIAIMEDLHQLRGIIMTLYAHIQAAEKQLAYSETSLPLTFFDVEFLPRLDSRLFCSTNSFRDRLLEFVLSGGSPHPDRETYSYPDKVHNTYHSKLCSALLFDATVPPAVSILVHPSDH